MNTISLWEEITKHSHRFSSLSKDIEVDVAIIGGGITGVTAAQELIKAGKKVALLEAETIGSGTTGFSTGNLYVPIQPFFQYIVGKFGFDVAKKIAHSRQLAIDYIENTVKEKNIPCHFSRRPWYVSTADKNKISMIEKEVELIKKMDIPIEYTKSIPFSIPFKKAAAIKHQARFNPAQYVTSLANDLHGKTCQIFENTRVLDISETDHCVLKTANGTVTAKQCIIATHTPIGINAVQSFSACYRSYVVAVHLKDNMYPEGHLWDIDEIHHSTCTHSKTGHHPELLMVAGNHHKTGQEPDAKAHYDGLEKYLRDHFSVSDVAYRWSAQHYHAADDVPYIGLASRFAKHTYMATGYFADGLIYGTIAGILLSDIINQKQNPLESVYNANRFTPLASSAFLMRENSNVFLQYMKDYPTFQAANFSDIKTGEGKVLDIDMEKCGVYRDEKGKLHAVSAVCTHMKGILTFNNAEKSWDCPCHGSRFTFKGEVIEGPAINNLKPIDIKEK